MDNEEQRDHAEEAYNTRQAASELEHTDWCALALDHDGRCESAAAVEAMRRRIGTGEGDALIAEAGQLPRTAAATAARVRGRLDRQAEELRAAGFTVYAPEVGHRCDPRYAGSVERYTFDVPGCPHMPACASYCPAVTHTFDAYEGAPSSAEWERRRAAGRNDSYRPTP